jgi:hypothetical protein
MASLFACFGCASTEVETNHYTDYPNEKAALLSDPHKAELIANDVVSTILHTQRTGAALRMELDSIVGTSGWRENIAQWVLEKLSRALEEGHELGPAVRDAYNKAVEIAMHVEGFVVEHPVFCTVVALGVLTLMSPWMLSLLGFAEEGIMEGMAFWCCSVCWPNY